MLSFLKLDKLKVKSTLLILFTQFVFLIISSFLVPNFLPEVVVPENKQEEIVKILDSEDLISQEIVESVLKLYLIISISFITGTYISVSIVIENFLYESK